MVDAGPEPTYEEKNESNPLGSNSTSVLHAVWCMPSRESRVEAGVL